MKINVLELLENEKEIRVKVSSSLRKKLLSNLGRFTEILSDKLKINNVTLRRKLLGRKGYSFKLCELFFLCSKLNIHEKEIFSNILDIKLGTCSYWSNVPKKIVINEEFVEGIGYYIGDGRMKTDKGLSTVNVDKKTLKFFLNWLIMHFDLKLKFARIAILTPYSSFDEILVKNIWAEELGIDPKYISSVKYDPKTKDYYQTKVYIAYYRKILKLILNLIIPLVKRKCLYDKELASAFIRGIMAAEGSPKFNREDSNRSVHLKMKDRKEVEYVMKLFRLFDINTKLLYLKGEDMWLIIVSGMNDLKKLSEMNIFKLYAEKNKRFHYALSTYRRDQVKKGEVGRFYLLKIFNLENKHKTWWSVSELAKYLNRHGSRVNAVLREFKRKGIVESRRIIKTGRPCEFMLTKKGRNLIKELHC